MEADWLQPDLELCVTDEIFNEINRSKDASERQRWRSYAQTFTRMRTDPDRVADVTNILSDRFPSRGKASDESDVRQLAHAIAADAKFFATRDTNLLAEADDLYDVHGILVVRPSDVVLHIDEMLREAEYRPSRLAGFGWRVRLAQARQLPEFFERFQSSESGETKASFSRRVQPYLAYPRDSETWVLVDGEGRAAALMVLVRPGESELVIPVVRVARGPLATTLARFLVFSALTVAARERRMLVRIDDGHASRHVTPALRYYAFSQVGGLWMKVTLPVVCGASRLTAELQAFGRAMPDARELADQLACAVDEAQGRDDTRALWDIEWVLWPVKIIDLSIPAYLVPIRPVWAAELFDQDLARQTLLGPDPGLVLSSENAYYRSARPGHIRAPARVLWYVSHDARFAGSMSLRASSRLDEVAVDAPKALYRRFRRLGVYTWQQVSDLADGEQTMMALRFSATEQFRAPVYWGEIQDILKEATGSGSQIQCPVEIPSICYAHLYSAGTGADVLSSDVVQ